MDSIPKELQDKVRLDFIEQQQTGAWWAYAECAFVQETQVQPTQKVIKDMEKKLDTLTRTIESLEEKNKNEHKRETRDIIANLQKEAKAILDQLTEKRNQTGKTLAAVFEKKITGDRMMALADFAKTYEHVVHKSEPAPEAEPPK